MQDSAARNATAALRAGTREAVVAELTASVAALADPNRDPREWMLDFAPFHDCCTRLGLDPRDVFDAAADAAPEPPAALMRHFGARTDVTLNVFGWRLIDGVYVFVLTGQPEATTGIEPV